MPYTRIDHSKNNEDENRSGVQPWTLVFFITFLLVFLVFLSYFLYHNRLYLKSLIVKNDPFEGNINR